MKNIFNFIVSKPWIVIIAIFAIFLGTASGLKNFKLVIVSNDFTELTNVKRHQCIYKALNDTMTRIHALSIQAFTLDEYLKNPIILKSPDCANK